MVRRQTTVKSSIERTVEVKYELAKQGDYLNLLGIDRADSDDEIRRAFIRWVKMVHPDNLSRNGIEHLRERAAVVFKALSAAYEIFSDKEKKRAWLAAYDNGGESGAAGEAAVQSRSEEEEAKIALHQARLLLRRRSWADAEELLKRFVETYPTDSRALTLLGWCVLQSETRPEKKRLKEARTFWETAIKADGEDADAHFHLSLYFKLTGNRTQQEKSLKRAIKHDKSHVAARREMRLLEMRQEKAENPTESMGEFFRRVWAKLGRKKGGDEEDEPAEEETKPDERRGTRQTPKPKRKKLTTNR